MKHFRNLIMTGALICAACFTSCKDDETEDTTVQSVTPTRTTMYIMQGSTASVAATVSPNNAAQEVRWTSEDPNIVSVVEKGQIDGISTSSLTGVSIGSANVTASSLSDPGKKATVQVTVTTRIDSVMVDIDHVSFVIGAEEMAGVEAAVMPADAVQTLTWTSSNTNVATVADGVIRAAGVGSAIITATSTVDPSKTATVEVEVLSLANKVIHVASKFGNGLTVSWVNLGGDLVEFFYTNEAGQATSMIMPVTTQSSYIPDFGSTPLSYRTLYFTQGAVRDTVQAPLVDFTGTVSDLVLYIRSSSENIISAADFDIGGEGIGFHDSNDNNTSLNYRRDRGDTRSDAVFIERGTAIGNQQKDCWYNYTVNVLDAGNYDIDFSVSAANTGGICRLYVDGEASADYSINNNGSYEDWRYYCDFNRLSPPKFYLSAGKHVIRVYVVAPGGWNFNGLKLTYKP